MDYELYILAKVVNGLKLKYLNNGFVFFANMQLVTSLDVSRRTGVVWITCELF